jgi:hypothetical protein
MLVAAILLNRGRGGVPKYEREAAVTKVNAMQRSATLVVLIIVSFFAVSTAVDAATTCAKATGDDAISACTREITSGNLKGQELASKFIKRGVAYANKSDYVRALADFDQAVASSAVAATTTGIGD